MRRRLWISLGAAIALIAGLASAPAVVRAPGARAGATVVPSRVLLIVIDGMRADYLDRYDLPNIEGLRDSGVGFTQSQVGYMSSVTVISHNVIASGQFPKNQGWSNEIYRDVDNALLGGAGSLYVMSSASCSDFALLATHGGYPKIEDYLGTLETDGDARMLSIAQKDRSACGIGQPADANDVVVGIARLSTGIECIQEGVPVTKRWRFPRGVNVPSGSGEMGEACSRFYVEPSADYGTNTTPPALLYPLDGHRFVPGFDEDRLGGDVWAADAAIELMQADHIDADDDDWRGLFVGIGGPDKIAHMWGPDDAVTGADGSLDDMIHLPGELQTADEQVGALMAELEAEGLADETLVVVTADHGMTEADTFYGKPTKVLGGGDFNWYYGAETGTRADESYLDPSPEIAALAARIGPNLAFSYQDTHVGVWLKSQSTGERKAAAAAMRPLAGAIATFRLNGDNDRYVQDWVSPTMSSAERSWYKSMGKILVNTMASPDAADAVALLGNDITYSVQGDHGGHQPDNQYIPIFFSGPGVPSGVMSNYPIRNVDILPTILEYFGIAPTAPMDGVAFDLGSAT